jgi:hypothetical protein
MHASGCDGKMWPFREAEELNGVGIGKVAEV